MIKLQARELSIKLNTVCNSWLGRGGGKLKRFTWPIARSSCRVIKNARYSILWCERTCQALAAHVHMSLDLVPAKIDKLQWTPDLLSSWSCGAKDEAQNDRKFCVGKKSSSWISFLLFCLLSFLACRKCTNILATYGFPEKYIITKRIYGHTS